MAKEKKKIIKREAPEKKIRAVDELASLIKESNSVVIVSIKNLPARQFQLIKKQLRDRAVIKVMKKNIMARTIEKVDKIAIKELAKYLKEDQAFIFSKLNPFELSAILSKNKSMAKAKPGQAVNEEVVIEPGPTELIPGPIISELGSLGLKFSVEDGKISIRERKVILKAGDKVNEQAASLMSKLDIKPIAIGLEPVVAYDTKENKIYENIKIDQEKTLEEMKRFAGKALAFAVKIGYCCKETISLIIRRAGAEEKAIEKLIKEEKKAEEKQENNQQNTQGGQQ